LIGAEPDPSEILRWLRRIYECCSHERKLDLALQDGDLNISLPTILGFVATILNIIGELALRFSSYQWE
jgi:hypothetical protein